MCEVDYPLNWYVDKSASKECIEQQFIEHIKFLNAYYIPKNEDEGDMTEKNESNVPNGKE